MPIDSNTVIGTEDSWPLLGYNISMRQSELGLPPAVELLRLAALRQELLEFPSLVVTAALRIYIHPPNNSSPALHSGLV
jgi:hypothetical protein